MNNGRPLTMRKKVQLLLALTFPATPTTRAQDQTHWAFRKPSHPEPPARDSLKHAQKVRNPIDQFVLHRLEKAGVGRAEALGLDTYPDTNRFYRYRRSTPLGEPSYGRQVSMIGLKPKS